MSSGRRYQIKLANGRILGPLDLPRVRLLILENQIQGVEMAREYPVGEWQDINAMPRIGDLLVRHAQDLLKTDPTKRGTMTATAPSATLVLPRGEDVLPGATVVLRADQEAPEASRKFEIDWGAEGPPPEIETPSKRLRKRVKKGKSKTRIVRPPKLDEDRTEIAQTKDLESFERTQISTEDRRDEVAPDRLPAKRASGPGNALSGPIYGGHSRSDDATILFAGRMPADRKGPAKKKLSIRDLLKATAAAIALGIAAYQVLFDTAPEPTLTMKVAPIRPMLPVFTQGKADPSLSAKFYGEAMRFYVQDTVNGYRNAAGKLQSAVAADPNNVKALAMLASSYLNLIDSSNKDEKYFYVITKLIEMTRAKAVDLPETVIADVEFFTTVNKAEAAQNRIVEYTVKHQSFGLEMFYYLGLAFYQRGDAQNASRYLSNLPDNKVFSPKVFYLRGLVAEKLDDMETAQVEYGKAIKMYKLHARSHLRLADILLRQSHLKEAAPHLSLITSEPGLLSPNELARAYYLDAIVRESTKNWDIALGDIERAIRLDKNNPDYVLEYYSLKAKGGESVALIRNDARMYYFLGEGEKLLRQGKFQDALNQFLQARQINDKSPLPLVKIGDMFNRLHDVNNARINFKLATERAPNNIEVWSKYIDILIQSFEWDEAQVAMDRFRKLPVSQSAIDKAAGDLYAKQGRQNEAQIHYVKAMARESIDPDVYVAYAKSLMATKNFKDAPFFFALAARFDPLNVDALVNTARCIAESESIDQGIAMLQDELQKGITARAELIAAMGELAMQKGDWTLAQQDVEQAMKENVDYAYPWKLQAEIYMNYENQKRGMLDKALLAYQSYSDRNPSDPSGYLERFKIFIKKADYDRAAQELSKIFAIYPKYPNLHFYKGALYAAMGNHKASIDEYKSELQNNPGAVTSEIGLGKELLEVGDYQQALTYFNQAMQAQPQNPEAKQYSGYANYLLKNYQGAVALFRAALVFDKGNPVIYKRLGLAYRAMGDNNSAAQAFRTYLEMEPDAPDRGDIQRFL